MDCFYTSLPNTPSNPGHFYFRVSSLSNGDTKSRRCLLTVEALSCFCSHEALLYSNHSVFYLKHPQVAWKKHKKFNGWREFRQTAVLWKRETSEVCVRECIFFLFSPNHTCGLGRTESSNTSLYVRTWTIIKTQVWFCVWSKKGGFQVHSYLLYLAQGLVKTIH